MIGDITKLISFLLRWARGVRHARVLIFIVIATGMASGLANTGLLALIASVLSRETYSDAATIAGFAGLCLALLLTRFISASVLLRLAAKAVRELRVTMSRGVLATPLRQVEKAEPHRVLTTLTEDIPSITDALSELPVLLMQLFIVLGSFAFMGWLSWQALIAFLFILAFGIFIYNVPSGAAMKHFRAHRALMDTLMKCFRGVTEGSTELRLHGERRRAFFGEELEPAATRAERRSVSALTLMLGATAWGHVLFFAIIGLVLFVMPALGVLDSEVLTGYAVVVLYMMTPLQGVLQTLPTLSNAAVSLEAVERMGFLAAGGADAAETQALPAAEGPEEEAPESWKQLELVNVVQHYEPTEKTNGFVLGPVDLTLNRGELLFLTGGNGSGKTTLAKILTGLYAPDEGEIRLDSRPVGQEDRESYRQLFSAVFSDFFLFEKLLGLNGTDLDSRASEQIERFQLDKKVEVKDGEISTIDLSQGQRKRLALMTAYLEDRPIYLFDEWAADQDPAFREIFYRQLLPELKKSGKTTVVVSHDDRYYDVADRVIKLDYGKVQYDGSPAKLMIG